MRALAKRSISDAPPRTPDSQIASSRLSRSASSSSARTRDSISVSSSSILDTISSRPATGRQVKARKPRLAKGSAFVPSPFRPQVPAQLRIAHWVTPWSLRQLDEMRREVSMERIRKMNEVLIQSWAESTRKTHGAALLRFTEYCDAEGVSEEDRMPASPFLLATFLASLEGSVSESSIDGCLSGLQAWHTLNNAPWHGSLKLVVQVKKGCSKLAPPPKPPRSPVTLRHMRALQKGLDMFSSFDAAAWAVATCAFWGCCRLGELTVELDHSVDPRMSVVR